MPLRSARHRHLAPGTAGAAGPAPAGPALPLPPANRARSDSYRPPQAPIFTGLVPGYRIPAHRPAVTGTVQATVPGHWHRYTGSPGRAGHHQRANHRSTGICHRHRLPGTTGLAPVTTGHRATGHTVAPGLGRINTPDNRHRYTIQAQSTQSINQSFQALSGHRSFRAVRTGTGRITPQAGCVNHWLYCITGHLFTSPGHWHRANRSARPYRTDTAG